MLNEEFNIISERKDKNNQKEQKEKKEKTVY
jgi:hypothetical protein